jgi:hypothetical protein
MHYSTSPVERAVRTFVLAVLAFLLLGAFSGMIGTVKASDGSLLPPHSDYAVDTDIPPNGLYDELVLNVTVDVTVNGFFYVVGDMFDTSGVYSIQTSYAMTGLDVGARTVRLVFTGYLIQASGFDGPYQVNVVLLDDKLTVLDVNVHTTNPYLASDFQRLPAHLFPPHSDYVLDNDGDSLSDYLVTTVNVNVNVSGLYHIEAALFDSGGISLITSGSNNTFLSVGVHTVDIAFIGYALRASGFDGPYRVELQLKDGSTNLLNNNTYFTTPYTSGSFEQPPAAFMPPHTDRGLDLNGNSLFEYLIVTTSVAVFSDGMYHVEGTASIGIAENLTYLAMGIQTVDLLFIGHEIRKSGMDGPYVVDVVVRDVFSNVLDSGTHTTAAYSMMDFEPNPPCTFSPPHRDRGIDTDGDSEFNRLSVTVNVTADAPGFYEVKAELYDLSGTILIDSAEDMTYLGALKPSASLSFDGLTIFLSGIDGPYRVSLELYDKLDFLLDTDVHSTQPYLHTDFEAPPAVFDPPHSDYGLDTDVPPDGLFNFLVVDASIRVKDSGWYLLYGTLLDSLFRPITVAQAFANLSAGPTFLPLQFNGMNISDSGMDGPYVVYMDMVYFDRHVPIYAGNGVHITGPYNYTDFMAPASATIWGHVYNATDASPVEMAQITAVNYTYGWVSQTESNETGYYEIKAFDADFCVLIDSRDLQANITLLSVTGSVEITRYLEAPVPNQVNSSLVLADWDNIGYISRTEIMADNKSSRFMIDLMVGNRDGYVDQDELDLMESFLASETPSVPASTTDHLYVDGIHYDLVPGSYSFELDALGPVASPDPSYMTGYADFTSNTTIPVSNIHWLELNVTYDSDEETNVYGGRLPPGYSLWGYLPVNNVTISGRGSRDFTIDPLTDLDDGVWVNLTIGQGPPDTVAPQVLNVLINDQASPTYGLSEIPSVMYLNATIDDAGTGNLPIGGANYTIGSQNWASSTPMNPADGSFDSISEDVTVMIVPQVVTTTYCVYGWDLLLNNNTVGTCVSVVIVDDMAPEINNIAMTPYTFFLSTAPPTATLTATLDESSTGSSGVSGANYTTPLIDSWPGVPMIPTDGTFDEPVEDVAANVPLPTSAGVFDYYVHAWDANLNLNNSAPAVQITIIDDVGPGILGPELNGQATLTVSPGTSVLLNATVDDTGGRGGTPIQGSNYTIDGDWGTSTSMFAIDGTFDEASEVVNIILDTSGWPDGTYQICVYGWDSSPNYNTTGGCASLSVLSVDDMPPEVLNVSIDGVTTLTVTPGYTFTLTGTIDDSSTMGSIILSANYSIEMAWTGVGMYPTDGSFNGPMENVNITIDTAGWPDSTYQICVHGSDDVPNHNITFSACAQLTIQTPPDVQIPSMENETAEPSTQEPGQFVRISVNVYDNAQVNTVSVSISNPSGGLLGNHTMNYDSINREYYYSDSFNDIGTHTYTIWASDTSNNWNVVSGNFEITAMAAAPFFLEEYWWVLVIIVVAVVAAVMVLRKLRVGKESTPPAKKAPKPKEPTEATPSDEAEHVPPVKAKTAEIESVVKCLHCGDAVLVAGDRDLLKTRCEHCGSTLLEVSQGYNYLIVDDDPSVAFQGFKSILKKKIPGLCISTTFPEKLSRRYDVEGATLYWLTDAAAQTSVHTLDPKRLEFEMMRAISNFLKESPEGAVMIDGVENLIVENGFDDVFRFLKKINDLASVGGATIFVSLAPSSLGKDELALLQKEFDKVQILASHQHN